MTSDNGPAPSIRSSKASLRTVPSMRSIHGPDASRFYEGDMASVYSMSTTQSSSSKRPRLKKVLIPNDCIPEFLRRAERNTREGIETLATLLGVKERVGGERCYRITTLFIPQQEGSKDQCRSTDDGDSALFQFALGHKLLQLGWIHTHPTWECAYHFRTSRTHLTGGV